MHVRRVEDVINLCSDSGQLLAEGISFSVDGQCILEDVSISVSKGEIVGLLGRDGAGKTCLFEILAGQIRPDRGRVKLNGADVTDATVDERALLGISYLPEEISVFRDLTVDENLAIALDRPSTAPDARSARLEQLLSAFQLDRLRHQTAATLSGGERRRCEVARAVATNPAFLLLDEPFKGLDPMTIREIKELVSLLSQEKIGALVSDYDVHDMIELMDRVYVIHQGQLIFGGSTNALLRDPLVRRLYLGESFAL